MRLLHSSVVRWIAWSLAALLALLVIAALMATNLHLLSWAIEYGSAGAVRISGAQGSLAGPLQVTRITLAGAERDVVVENVALDWQPSLLRRHVLRIDALRVGKVTVVLKPGRPEPATLPQDFPLPLDLDAPDIAVDALIVQRQPAGAAAQTLVSAGGVRLAARGGRPWLEVELAGVRLSRDQTEVDVQATLRLQSVAPFALNAQILADTLAAQRVLHASLRATGTLSQLSSAVELFDRQRQPGPVATVDLDLRPYAPLPVAGAHIVAQGFDPSQWMRGLPRAELDLRLDLTQTAEQKFQGSLSLRNAHPGPLDRGLIPVASVGAQLAGDPAAQIQFTQLQFDLGAGGRLSGSGTWTGEALTLALRAEGANARALYSALEPTRLAGVVNLDLTEQKQGADLQLSDTDMRLTARVARDARETTFRASIDGTATGALQLEGALAAGDAQALRVEGRLAHLNLARLGALPVSDLNADFTASGALAPKPRADFALTIGASRVRGYPLSGTARGRWTERRLDGLQVALAAGANTLQANGMLTPEDNRFTWKIDAPDLAQLGEGFAGRVQGEGTLSGRLDALALHAVLDAGQVRAPGGVAVGSLSLRGDVQLAQDAPFKLEASAQELRAGKSLQLASLRLTGAGTSNRHTLALSVKGRDVDLGARLSGGYFAPGTLRGETAGAWSGTAESLENNGRYALKLLGPTSLTLASNHQRARNARFDLNGGHLVVAEFDRSDKELVTRGEVQQFPTHALLDLWPVEGLASTLVLTGRWEVQMRESLNGKLTLARDRGDVEIAAGGSPLTLGLSELALGISVQDGNAHAQARLVGRLPGTVEGTFDVALSRDAEGTWILPVDNPVRGSLRADVPSLKWLSALANDNLAVDGKVEAQVDAGGTLAKPQLKGSIHARNLTVAILEQGVNLREGKLDAQLSGQDLVLQELVFRGGDGRLEASGRASYAPDAPLAGIEWQATRLEAVKRPDRHVVVSGKGRIDMRDQRLAVRGKLVIDEGLILGEEAESLVVSNDVVVAGRPPRPAQEGTPLPLILDLEADLGERFTLRAKGLDTMLAGSLRLTSSDRGTVLAVGTVRTSEGIYRAYGQRLEIDHGVVGFTGPIDNPALDILAVRKGGEVEAGVSVQGTAQHPRVKLVSNPNVSDSEKLSWLVLGKGSTEGDTADMAKVQAAGRILLEQGASGSLDREITASLGVDDVSVRRAATASDTSSGNGSLSGAVVSLGKRVSSKVYVGYEQGLAGAASAVKINYTLSKRWSVRLAAGSDNALDVFYKFTFD